MLSAVGRGALFLGLTVSHGRRKAIAALLVEAVYRTVSSGFYGALTQKLRYIKPAWVGIFIFAIALPVVVQGLDCGLHVLTGTPNLLLGITISAAWTALASLFDWYAMRQGVLITGAGSQSLWADVKAIPRVFAFGCNELFGPADDDQPSLVAED
jgi:hypothetical protein